MSGQRARTPVVVGIDDISEVVSRGLCVGCGACSVATSGRVPVTIGRYGAYRADSSEASDVDRRRASVVCPFSDRARNEDDLAEDHLPPDNARDTRIGSYSGLFAGRVTSDDYLIGSSSGGLTSWVASALLSEGMVDAVIHVGGPARSADQLFDYRVSSTVGEIESARKSAYYSASLADAVDSIRSTSQTYALIGVPCVIKAARLLCEQDPDLGGRISYFLGLVCGHMKSAGFAESMAWQAGVHPDDLEQVDFRVKNPETHSGDYGFAAKSASSGRWSVRPTQSLVGGNWGHGMFQLDACNFCDDIFAETADIAFGDAWLPEYKADWRGTNIIVTRRPELSELLERGRASGELFLESLDPEDVVASQAGNFRHRRIGLAVRLHDDIERGLPVPRKRVSPSLEEVSRKRRRLVRLRRRMSEISHVAFLRAKEADDLDLFLRTMRPLMRKYARTDARPFFSRVISRSRKILARLRVSQ